MLKRFWPLLAIITIVVLAAIIIPAAAGLMPGVNNYDAEFYPTFITLSSSLANFPDDVKAGEPFEVFGRLYYTSREYADQNGNLVQGGFTGPPETWDNQPAVTLPFPNRKILVYVDGYNMLQEVITDENGNYHATFQIGFFYGPVHTMTIHALFGGEVHMHYYPGTSRKPLRTVYMVYQTAIPERSDHGSLNKGTIFSGLSSVIVVMILAFAIPFTVIAAYFVYRYRRQIRGWLKRRKVAVMVPEPANTETLAVSPEAVREVSTGDPRVEILFPQIENPLPPVWGIGEPLTISSRALVDKAENDIKSQPQVEIKTNGLDITVTDFSPVRLEHTFNSKGETEINVRFGIDSGEQISGTRQIRLVDYREEIVALFNQLIDSLATKGINIDRMMTAREIETNLREKNPDISSETIQDIVNGFEYANYSLHPVARKIYVDMYLAVTQIEERMKNA